MDIDEGTASILIGVMASFGAIFTVALSVYIYRWCVARRRKTYEAATAKPIERPQQALESPRELPAIEVVDMSTEPQQSVPRTTTQRTDTTSSGNSEAPMFKGDFLSMESMSAANSGKQATVNKLADLYLKPSSVDELGGDGLGTFQQMSTLADGRKGTI